MSEKTKEPEHQPAIRPYMSTTKAITLIQDMINTGDVQLDSDDLDALKLAIGALNKDLKRQGIVFDPRD